MPAVLEVMGDDYVGLHAAHLRAIAPLALRHRLRRNPLDDTDSGERVNRSLQEILAA